MADDIELKKLRRENAELVYQHQLDIAEIILLRRWIERLEEGNKCLEL